MVYSGAIWEAKDTLETAQLRKIDYHVAQAKAANAKRVLDICCGWGAVLKRLVEEHGVERAVGLTLSDAQAGWIKSNNHPQIAVGVESWSDHVPEDKYDAIISIGAFEHFAKIEFSDLEKVESYKAFFARCHEWLRPGSYMSLQTFAYGNTRRREEAMKMEATQFLAKEIFPETDPPRLANIAEATEELFEIVSIRNDRSDYALTCRTWLDNLEKNRSEAVNVVGEEVVDRYQRYLMYSFIGFQTGNLALFRITLRRIDTPWKKNKR
jgi:cyclopropane-fatty-acyl-phospholipid synthase